MHITILPTNAIFAKSNTTVGDYAVDTFDNGKKAVFTNVITGETATVEFSSDWIQGTIVNIPITLIFYMRKQLMIDYTVDCNKNNINKKQVFFSDTLVVMPYSSANS